MDTHRIPTHDRRCCVAAALSTELGRTVSESSEGCGMTVELEMNEDFSLTGSLGRRRHREDSAYMSQRDSMSGGPPDTPSPEMEEEDQNGYVLPGDSPERESIQGFHSFYITHPPLSVSSHRPDEKVSSSGLLDDPDDEEYEYMNKQTPASLRHNSHWLKANKKRTSSVSSQLTACSGDTTSSMEVRGLYSRSKDNSDSEQQGPNDVEYEYMDVRVCGKEGSPPVPDPPPPPTPARIRGQVENGVEDDNNDEEYVEDSDYHYTNKQPKLRQALQDRKELKVQGSGDEAEAYEYEDMDCFAAVQPGDTVVYQNMRRDEEGAVGGAELHRSAFEPYVKVRSGVGVGEPVAGDRSFDNPDYWHSRMFLKPNAVPT
ncbi:hypothetical protein INR49_007437 [Caranx melampygus]|nr:hypothetical protein INR49_007437 [Caranx melampygus]